MEEMVEISLCLYFVWDVFKLDVNIKACMIFFRINVFVVNNLQNSANLKTI